MAGAVNFADDVDGVSVGVLSFSRTGYNHLNAWVDANGMVNAGATFGGKHLYTTLSVGTHAEALTTLWTAQLGLGGHVPVGAWFVDMEASAGNFGPIAWNGSSLLTRGKRVVGRELAPHIALFAGPTFDLLLVEGAAGLPERAWLPGGTIAADNPMPWRLGLAFGVRI